MATATRIYIVTIGECDRLVRASHPNAALMHVVRDIAAVGVASQDELVDCLADGIKVENIKEEAAAEPTPKVERESMPLWPMPTQPNYSPPEVPAGSVLNDSTPTDSTDDDDSFGDDEDDAPQPLSRRIAQTVPARYRCAMTGSTWSGRGIKPAWLRVALDSGKPLSDFLVIQPSTAQV
jgi:hypothetical protein